MYWFIPNYFGNQFNYTRRKIRHKSIRDFSWWKSTVCPRSSDPFMCNLLYKTGHYFLYRLYGLNNRCMIPVDKLDGSDDYGNYTSMRGTFTSRIWMPDVFLDRGKAIRGVFFYIFGLLNTGVYAEFSVEDVNSRRKYLLILSPPKDNTVSFATSPFRKKKGGVVLKKSKYAQCHGTLIRWCCRTCCASIWPSKVYSRLSTE